MAPVAVDGRGGSPDTEGPGGAALAGAARLAVAVSAASSTEARTRLDKSPPAFSCSEAGLFRTLVTRVKSR